MDLYHGLKMPLLSVDERLDVLLNVKWTVKVLSIAACVHIDDFRNSNAH